MIAGDRLEPSQTLPDVSLFYLLDTFPWPLVFWRCTLETVTRHRNPLLSLPHLGLVPHRVICIDLLHALYLGIMKSLGAYAMWLVLLSGVLAPNAGTQDEQLTIGIMAIKAHLFKWHKTRHQQNPKEKLTRVSDITRKMLGDPGTRNLKVKGADCWAALLFLIDFLTALRRRLPADCQRVVEAMAAIRDMVVVFQTAGIQLTEAEINSANPHYKRYVYLTQHIEQLLQPKRHIMWHMLERLEDFGNPIAYSNWYDEHLNKLLNMACRTASQHNFEEGLQSRMRPLLAQEHDKLLARGN